MNQYYDKNHKQEVSIDLTHEHNGVKPHRHIHLKHGKNLPGEPPKPQELGLDFIFRGNEYRFNTGSMYEEHNTLLPDGREAIFGLYKKNQRKKDGKDYTLLEEFACMEDVLKSTCIEGIEFSKIIMDDDTELVGQD